jgi:hypothetical protein
MIVAGRTRIGLPRRRWRPAGSAAERIVRVGRERLRQILRTAGISFQRTRTWTWTWKESTDPDKEAKLDRIEEVTRGFPHRCFAFDQFGPLSVRPAHGTTWARESKPTRLPATYRRTHRPGADKFPGSSREASRPLQHPCAAGHAAW